MTSIGSRLMDLGEEEVIKRIMEFVDDKVFIERLPKGDDARDLVAWGFRIVTALDGYSIVSVKLPWRTMRDVGWCAITSVVSDIVSKGGIPTAVLIGLGLPKEWNINDLIELFRGFREAANEYNLRILGGDMNSSKDPWIAVACIGFSSAYNLPPRSGAKPGDVIVITGSTYGAMGVAAIDGLDKAMGLKWVVEATRRPRVYVETAYVIQNHSKAIHSTMDVSDGLAYTLHAISVSSGVELRITDKPLYTRELDEYCSGNERCVWDRILYGGEEYGIVMTIDRGSLERVLDDMNRFNIPYKVVGEVREGPPRVLIEDYGVMKPGRWDQFKAWITY